MPLPGRDGVAEESFEERPVCTFAIVAIGENDHAGLVALEADHKRLCAVAMAFLKESLAEFSLCQ